VEQAQQCTVCTLCRCAELSSVFALNSQDIKELTPLSFSKASGAAWTQLAMKRPTRLPPCWHPLSCRLSSRRASLVLVTILKGWAPSCPCAAFCHLSQAAVVKCSPYEMSTCCCHQRPSPSRQSSASPCEQVALLSACGLSSRGSRHRTDAALAHQPHLEQNCSCA